MNKEIIKQFKNEFNHWLDGEEILVCNLDGSWQLKVNNHWTYPGPYVINDKYVEFRKALAEGKTIQYNRRNESKVPCDEWVNFEYTIFGDLDIQLFRIKPGEPQFKVGDWITHPRVDGPFKFTKYDTCDMVKLWEPQPREWCWFWNNASETPTLDQLRNTDKHIRPYIAECEGRFAYCEPFIGELPTTIQIN